MKEEIIKILDNYNVDQYNQDVIVNEILNLINKPVETTNEQLIKCHCGSLLPKDGKSCGSMWCPNED